MPDTKLKTGVLGLNDNGRLLLEAASQSDYFQIQAVADKDAELAEKTSVQYQCASHDDYRQLIIQNQLDCLLVAAGIHSCDEHIKTAMKKKFNILKLAPPARNFEEAAELVQLAEKEDIKFAVANPCRFMQSFIALRDLLQQEQIENIFLITAVCTIGNQHYPPWQNDPKLAGGGVLLHNCYEIIDQITWNFSTPQQVYSLNTNTAGDRKQRLYLTEDTAVVTMKFTDASFGNLIASRYVGADHKQKLLKIHGRNKVLMADKTKFIVSDATGQVSERYEYHDDELCCRKRLLENFALSILSPDKNKLCSSAEENLKNMAVIESAYLSARTGFPEQPRRIPQMTSRDTSEPIDS